MNQDSLQKRTHVLLRAMAERAVANGLSEPARFNKWKPAAERGNWLVGFSEGNRFFVPDFRGLIDVDELERLEEAFLELNPRFRNEIYIGNDGGKLDFLQILQHLFRRAFEVSDNELLYVPSRLEESLEEFWAGLNVTEVNVTFVACLQRFRSSMDTMKVTGENLSVRVLDPDEVNRVYPFDWNLRSDFLPHGNDMAIEGSFLCKLRDAGESKDPSVEDTVRDRCNRLVQALNILGPGGCRLGRIFVRTDLCYPFVWLDKVFDRQAGPVLGTPYRFTSDKLAALEAVVDSLRQHELERNKPKGKKKSEEDPSRALLLGVNRLVEARTRASAGDRFLDAVFALEILLCDAQSELSYRFALHFASLFEPALRLDKHDEASLIYKVRSKVVHGASDIDSLKLRGRTTSLDELSEVACEMAQHVVYKALTDPSFHFRSRKFWAQQLLRPTTEHQTSSPPLL